ncbi:MAG: hypothetical protein J2P37_27520 [Ktedonobacteraceae bacterium]|nr:hypothetical protein [Ktedonobacteraceae bacterium]MBO0793464.1 hypothetical protein [Ktedonobacteraceae bacterium]
MARIYGFDWNVYEKRIMPAFARWLIDDDETALYRLYERTRCAREEGVIPPAMREMCTWTRAQAFLRQLPRGPYSYREYHKLCSAQQFTALSDLYVYRHPPRLYQTSEAVRAVWGAVVEEYCVPWLSLSKEQELDEEFEPEATREELVDLLQRVGLSELAQEVSTRSESRSEVVQVDEKFDQAGVEDMTQSGPPGVQIGRHPTPLHLRGWLATISVRAMALFELLACGRRSMPFGHRANEPFESYIGYLTPDEVWQLALCLRSVRPPHQAEAEEHYKQFRLRQATDSESFCMIDEVLPAHAGPFVRIVRIAASQGLGLICSIE